MNGVRPRSVDQQSKGNRSIQRAINVMLDLVLRKRSRFPALGVTSFFLHAGGSSNSEQTPDMDHHIPVPTLVAIPACWVEACAFLQ